MLLKSAAIRRRGGKRRRLRLNGAGDLAGFDDRQARIYSFGDVNPR